MDECDSESTVHAEYTSDLTYTSGWLKVNRNRVLLTLFSALLESPRSPDSIATNRAHEKVPETMFEVTQETQANSVHQGRSPGLF